jgi:hypothetical protein
LSGGGVLPVIVFTSFLEHEVSRRNPENKRAIDFLIISR